jgi:shikimate kinase
MCPNSNVQIPNPRKHIFLTGMPAAGKTYWGQKISEKYQLDFTDLDAYISLEEKASIPALFAQYGENGFREKENKALKKLIKQTANPSIVACGGGTPCFYDNMSIMKQAGIVIYLLADIPWLMNNISSSDEIRPLLKGRGDVSVYLADLLKKRKPFYEQANYILPTKDISLLTFNEIISSCINRQ